MTNIDSWIERNLSAQGDDQESIAIKKRFLLFILPTPFFMALFGLLFWFLETRLIAIGLWIFGIANLLILFTFLIYRKYTEKFIITTLTFYLLSSFVGVLYYGGILHSGGIVFVGLAGAIVSLSYLKPKQFKIIFVLYIFSVILEAFLQPLLRPCPEFTPPINLALFVLHILVITGVMFTTLSYYLDQSIQAKQAEADRLRELDKIKTRFYTNITHEFRTPLTIILGMADQIGEKPKEFFQNGLNLIRRNGNRLLYLVNQMLDLSKLEAGILPLNWIQGDILKFVRYLTESFESLAEEKNIHFRFLSDLDEVVMDFDPEKIESLVSNLLTNAIKYSPEGADVYCMLDIIDKLPSPGNNVYSLRFSNYENDSQVSVGKRLKLTIKNTGVTIPAGQLNQIFDRFYQVKSDTSRNSEGTGIGLALVKELVKIMKGDLFVKSNSSEGTTFTIFLPVKNQAIVQDNTFEDNRIEIIKEEGALVEDLTFSKKRPQLLIVEDNADVVEYIRTIVETSYEIDVAPNGEKGIEKAFQNIPDIILSDIMMPGKDGFELCKTLKNDFRTSHIPIIILTAMADMSSKITGLEQGADAYLTKPFNRLELQVRLQKLIELRENLKAKFRLLTMSSTPIDKPTNQEEIFIDRLKQILQENSGDENFDTNQLGHLMGISRVQLFRKLKALTGQSASQVIRSFRLSKAKDMILSTQFNISEIAFEVGFKDPAYFTRVFTKEFGFAPSSLRSTRTL